MRIAIVGQQKFGKAVLDAFLERGDTVAGVFCAPEKAGTAPDPLRVGAEERGIRLFQLPSLKTGEAREALRGLDVDLGVMAYVLQFAPQEFCKHSPPRHDSVPPLAAAQVSRSELHQLADHSRRHAHRTHHLPSERRPRRGSGDSAERDADRSGRHPGLGLLRSVVPARDPGAHGSRRPRGGRPRHRDRPGRVAGELRGLVPRPRGAGQLAQSHRLHLQLGPRLQSGAGRLDSLERQEGQALRSRKHLSRTFSAGEGQDRHGGLDRRQEHARERAGRPARGVHLAVRRRQEAERSRILRASRASQRAGRQLALLAAPSPPLPPEFQLV